MGGRLAENVVWPFASVATSACPRYDSPSPCPDGSAVELEKNSSRNDAFGSLSSVPSIVVSTAELRASVSIGKFCRSFGPVSESPASFDGHHYRFDEVYLEPKPTRPKGPQIWIGGSTAHPAVVRRLVEHGDGFHPLGQPSDEELQNLRNSLRAADRKPSQVEWVGGVRGKFPDDRSPADLDEALEQIPQQVSRGFGSICVKPSQFIDSLDGLPHFCAYVVRRAAEAVT